MAERFAEELENVQIELQKIERKWGRQRHDNGVWSMILLEEMSEVCHDALQLRSLPLLATKER